MNRTSAVRPTVIVAVVALVAWIGSGAVYSVMTFAGIGAPFVRNLISTVPPVNSRGITIMTAAVLTAVFLAVLLPLVRAALGGAAPSRAATLLAVWGATFLALAASGVAHAVLSVTVFAWPLESLVPQVPNMIGTQMLIGLWLGPLLGVVATALRPRQHAQWGQHHQWGGPSGAGMGMHRSGE